MAEQLTDGPHYDPAWIVQLSLSLYGGKVASQRKTVQSIKRVGFTSTVGLLNLSKLTHPQTKTLHQYLSRLCVAI